MRIGLALSGGGTRAVAFHLGVLARLAAGELLEKVTKLSTVSGGSLTGALVFSSSGLKWPTSARYLDTVLPALARLLGKTDLFTFASILRSPREWYLVPRNRATIVANLLVRQWGVTGRLRDLGPEPQWFINTTCIETGKNWRFSQTFMGDWKAGHHYDPQYTIAEAVAASAAVPYIIGALRLSLPEDGWYEIDPATDQPRGRRQRAFSEARLWDGGAYENLGLEPLYKPDRGMVDCDYVLASDASGPLPVVRTKVARDLLKGHLASPRLFDIASDQIRSLRSRMLVDALLTHRAEGALIRMGNSVRDIDIRSGRKRPTVEYANFQTDRDVSLALKHPTSLASIPSDRLLRIVRHGFEVADATLVAYCSALAPEQLRWESDNIVSEREVATAGSAVEQ